MIKCNVVQEKGIVFNVQESCEALARFRDEIRSRNSSKKLATPEGNSQLDSNCPNSKAPETHLKLFEWM